MTESGPCARDTTLTCPTTVLDAVSPLLAYLAVSPSFLDDRLGGRHVQDMLDILLDDAFDIEALRSQVRSFEDYARSKMIQMPVPSQSTATRNHVQDFCVALSFFHVY